MTQPSMPHKKDFLPIDQAVKIKCCYCDVAEICTRRAQKEHYEASGMVTRCTMTPNRPGDQRKQRKKVNKRTKHNASNPSRT